MELNDDQYGRVARYLDGEQVDLSEAELAMAEEVCRAEAELPAFPATSLPGPAAARVRRRMLAELAHPQRGRRFAWPSAAAAAVALAVALAYLVPSAPRQWSQPLPVTTNELAEAYSQADQNLDLELIAAELAELEADVLVSTPPGPADQIDLEMDALQDAIGELWLDERDNWPEEVY